VLILVTIIASPYITYRAILNGLSDPDLPLKQRRQRPEFTAATTTTARWIGKNQTIIFTRCYYGASIQKLQRRQQDTDGTATPGVEPKFVPRANGGWKEFVPRANGGWKEFVPRANGGWKEFVPRANGGWKEFVPRANGGWKEFVTRANGGWKEIKKRKEKRFPIRGLDKEKKRDFPSGDWIKSGSERKRSERKNRNDKLTGCLATCS
jgi:hypothetical protein